MTNVTFILGVAVFKILLATDVTAEVIKDASLVSLQYTVSEENGKSIESNIGKEPLKYVHGRRMMIPGLEKELTGMKVDQEKHVIVRPQDAYGPVDPKAVQEFPKDKIPPEGQKVGAVLNATNAQGWFLPVRVKEVKERSVVLDMNHPMAGKTLVFDVKVLDIQSSLPWSKKRFKKNCLGKAYLLRYSDDFLGCFWE